MVLLAYDGTDLHGWQYQENARSVQGELIAALARMAPDAIRLRASGRTDAGVHAEALPVTFQTRAAIPSRGLLRGLNSLLPEDIAVRAVREMPHGFDARSEARGKRYHYDLWSSEWPNPLRRRTSWWLRGAFPDTVAMARAAELLVGNHDFAAFRSAQCDSPTTRRRLKRVEVNTQAPHLIRIVVEGDAFLQHMVRIIVGTLVDVGRGRKSPAQVSRILASGDRVLAGQTAPAQGLTLEKVFFAEDGWPAKTHSSPGPRHPSRKTRDTKL